MNRRKRTRKARQESERLYSSLFTHALEGIFRSTPEGRFLDVNPALVRMLGYESAEEVLALTLPDDLYGDPTQRAHLRAAYEAGGVLEGVEVRWKKKGGEHIIVNLQEALTNACNHAQARNIDIDLIFGMHQVQLRIQDDGRGFDGAVGNGFGLISMRERAERIGGQLTMTSRPGQGTVVEVVVPYTESMTLQESCYEQETPNSRAHRR